MALKSLPLRQDARPGTNDAQYARAYDPAAGGWTAPVAALPSDEDGDGTCNPCGSLVCRCGQDQDQVTR